MAATDIVARGLVKKTSEQLAEIENRLKALEGERVYGIRWTISTDTFTRLSASKGMVACINGAQNDFDNVPIFRSKLCNLADNKTVNAYFGEPSYTEDGSNGQVMAEKKAFYYFRYAEDADNIVTLLSETQLADFKLHPWFYDENGNPVSKRYFSSYEGCLYDDSTGSYILDDAQVADFNSDKLSSIANAKPISGRTQNLTRSNARKLANNRGYEQQYFNAISAIQMLMSVEFCGYNFQDLIGRGVASISDDGTSNLSINTGDTASLGEGSGYIVNDSKHSVRYRGIENFWGNLWKFADGINIQNALVYLSSINGNFVDDVFDGQYEYIGDEVPTSNGYMSQEILNDIFDWGYLPKAASGSSSTKYADYFYRNTGNRVALFGGGWSNGSGAGAFCWSLSYSASSRDRYIGARLCV